MKRIDPLDFAKFNANKTAGINKSTMPEIPFDNFFQEALNFEAEPNKQVKGPEYNFNQKTELKFDDDAEILAQAMNPNEIQEVFQEVQRRREQQGTPKISREDYDPEDLSTRRLEITPFQMFIDKAVEVLESVSEQDFKVNDLIQQYIRGEVSIDEVSVEMSKLSLAVSFVSTVLSSATSTFKEITQLAI